MAYARDVNDYTSEMDSLTAPLDRQFDVTFPFIAKEHVIVLVNGTQTYNYFWVNDNRIELDNKPNVGDVITVVRETSPSVRLVDYQTGSVLSEEILDQDSLQGFYLAQEANDIKEIAMSRDAANLWDANYSRISNLADPLNDADAANKQWVLSTTSTQVAEANAAAAEAKTYKGNAYDSQVAAAGSASLASQNNAAAAAKAVEAATQRNEAAAFRNETKALLNAAKIPGDLTNKAKQFLQVKADETGYVLVSSVAAPAFYGFHMSADGEELLMTYGRDDYDVNDFDTWTMSENVTFNVIDNNLVVVL